MQSPDAGDDTRLTFYCKDPDSTGKEMCETFYSTDRGSWMMQGKRRGPAVADQLVALATDETFLEMSGQTVDLFVRKYVEERYGIDLPQAPLGPGEHRS